MDINSRSRDWVGACAALALLGCTSDVPELGPIDTGCVARVTGTDNGVLLVQRTDQSLWAGPPNSAFARIDGPDGALRATDSAASGVSGHGGAIGCAVISGNVWCFPLVAGSAGDAARQVLSARSAAATPLSNVIQIAGGTNGDGATFCAVSSDGKAWCWGDDPSQLLLASDDSSDAQPVLLDENTELSAVSEVRVGFDSACARRTDGSVWCWGMNEFAQLGALPDVDGAARAASPYPVQVALPAAATRLAASPGQTHCAILEDTRVACWGHNESAQAGASTEQLSVPPTIVRAGPDGPAFSTAVDLAPDHGLRAMCANTEDAGLWCWGDVQPVVAAPARAASPYPVQLASSPQGRIRVPLSAYGADNGTLIYINANGRLVFGAGSMASSRQPPCP